MKFSTVCLAIIVLVCFFEIVQCQSTDAKKSNSKATGKKRNMRSRIWPKGTVYYKFSQDVSSASKKKILIALAVMKNSTCLKFVEAPDRKTGVIDIRQEGVSGQKGCMAILGYVASIAQELILTPGACDNGVNYAGSAVHELMHAVGLEHEFQRHDRDKYIQFHQKNVKGSKAAIEHTYGVVNFETHGLPFNFKSILQYDPRAGSKSTVYVFTEKKATVDTAKPIGTYENMGQECRLSAGDRNLVEETYFKECGKKAPQLVPTSKEYDVRIPGTDCSYKLHPINDIE